MSASLLPRAPGQSGALGLGLGSGMWSACSSDAFLPRSWGLGQAWKGLHLSCCRGCGSQRREPESTSLEKGRPRKWGRVQKVVYKNRWGARTIYLERRVGLLSKTEQVYSGGRFWNTFHVCWQEAVGASLGLLMWLRLLLGWQEWRVLSQSEHWIPEALSQMECRLLLLIERGSGLWPLLCALVPELARVPTKIVFPFILGYS